MKPQHTPTPWVDLIWPELDSGEIALTKEDFNHAVKCVDAHEQLLKAAKDLIKYLEDDTKAYRGCMEKLNPMIEAIVKAEGDL